MQESNERTYLLDENRTKNGLSTIFAIICILDVFGVFPVVTLPKTIMDCGMWKYFFVSTLFSFNKLIFFLGFYGIAIIFPICSTQIYTAALLGRCWIIAEEISPSIKTKNRYPYAALAEITFGKKLSSFVTFLLDLTVFGGGIPNLIVGKKFI